MRKSVLDAVFLKTTLYLLIVFLHNAQRIGAEENVQPNCTLVCHNGGVCQINDEQQQCFCLAGFVGTLCEIPYADPTPLDPTCTLTCEKGGRCETIETDEGTMMHCVCESIDGIPCQYKNDATTGDSTCTLACWNDGVCMVGVNGDDDSYCVCPEGFEGFFCEQQSNGGKPSPIVLSQRSKKGGMGHHKKMHMKNGRKKRGRMDKEIIKDTDRRRFM